MPAISIERLYTSVRDDTASLAGLVTVLDEASPVPTCPEWAFRQLITHVGRAHRWAAEIVTRRSAEFIQFRDVPGGKLPASPAERAGWLNDGAALLIQAIRDGAGEQVWTPGGMGPASYWARRMAHETSVHLADAQLAAGLPAPRPADVAADGIDEWLGLVTGGSGQALLGDGQSMHVHATDDGLDGSGEWLVRRTPSGTAVEPGHARADVALRGPAASLLFVLVRRLPAADPGIEVLGDEALLARWLEQTPF